MIALIIIIVLLTLLLLLPVGAEAAFIEGALTASARIGPLKLRLLPTRAKAGTPREKKAKKEKPPRGGKPRPRLTREDIFGIARLGLKALSRLRRSISVDYFMLHITAASSTPYDAVMLYGYINSAIGVLRPMLHRAFCIREEDIGAAVDMDADRPSFDAALTATIQIWEILYIAICALFGFLAWTRKRKVRAKKEAADENIGTEKG